MVRLIIFLLCASLASAGGVSTRRHRHLNPRFAGASLVLDARYITGLNDGDAVGTWSNRSGNGNDATQGTAANKPLYRVQVIRGQPVVVFDGTNDRLTTGSATIETAVAIVSVSSRPWTSAKYAPIVTASHSPDSGKWFGTSGSTVLDWVSKDMLALGDGYSSGRAPRAFGSYGSVADNVPCVFSCNLNSSTAGVWMNGTLISTTSATGSVPATTGAIDIGAAVTEYSDAKIGMVALISPALLARPILRRLEHAAAYSFKISCQ